LRQHGSCEGCGGKSGAANQGEFHPGLANFILISWLVSARRWQRGFRSTNWLLQS
jgi:hypothetical protein